MPNHRLSTQKYHSIMCKRFDHGQNGICLQPICDHRSVVGKYVPAADRDVAISTLTKDFTRCHKHNRKHAHTITETKAKTFRGKTLKSTW